MILRRADMRDLEPVSELWVRMVNEAGQNWNPNPDWWRRIAALLFDAGTYMLFVAEENGKPVGFIDSIIFPEPATGKIHGTGQHFYILPEYRNGKASMMLYRTCIKEVKANGAQILDFCCFQSDIPKWQKKGWIPVRALMRRTANV